MKGRFVLVSLLLLGAIGTLAYSNATRTAAGRPGSTDASTAVSAEPERVTPFGATMSSETTIESAEPEPSLEITIARVEEWIADVQSEDRGKRSAAIIALAQAPRERAVPALRKALEAGDAETDRQLALRSLHTIAIEQGDDDGRIRDLFREAMYHGGDDGVTQSAQAYLEDIEAVLDEQR